MSEPVQVFEGNGIDPAPDGYARFTLYRNYRSENTELETFLHCLFNPIPEPPMKHRNKGDDLYLVSDDYCFLWSEELLIWKQIQSAKDIPDQS